MKLLIRYVLPFVIVAGAGIGAYAIYLYRPVPEMTRPEVIPPLVRTIEVGLEDVPLSVASQGTVEPRTESQLVPEVSGRVIRVSPSLVDGGFFEEGEVLLEIDPFDYRQAVSEARARVADAQLRLAREEAEADVARREWKELGEAGESNPLVLREPQLADARAAVDAAQAAQERAERDLARTEVRAPYAGRVRSEQVDVGQYVARGAPVATVYAVDSAEVRLPLPDEQLAYLDLPLDYRGDAPTRRGPRVILRADYAGRTFEWEGRIVRTEGEIDPRTRMVHVVASVDDPYGRAGDRPPLAVGMFVTAEIFGREASDVAVLPRLALRPGNRVWVVEDGKRLRFRDVKVLRADHDVVLIEKGLSAGEQVCISPMEAVTDGMAVRQHDEPDGPEVPETDEATL